MYIPNTYLNSDFEDARVHLKDMMKNTLEIMEALENDIHAELSYYDSIDTLNIIIEYSDLYKIDNSMLKNISPRTGKDVLRFLNNFYFEVVTKEVVTPYKELFLKKMYTFTDIEYESVQESINSLRSKINESTEFSNEHQERLLKKLEDLQREIHKKMSSYDKILGNVVGIGHILGKTTKEAQPFINEVKNILEIIFKSKEKVENLPNTSNQLETEDILQIDSFTDTESS